MANAYIFSLQPTFTQGFVIGQLFSLLLLVFMFKYLFFDTTLERPYKSSYQPRLERDATDPEIITMTQRLRVMEGLEGDQEKSGVETSEWLNVLVQQILQSYREKLREDRPGAEGEEIARQRVERFANSIRPPAFLDPIKVHSVDLGVSAPRLTRARLKNPMPLSSEPELEFNVSYVDTVSISLSTSVLFNYPLPFFARLPVSLTVSLSHFSSSITLTPPQPHSPHPTMTFTLPPDFTLNLRTTSLMGSRAKLADVPKLHELITNQIRRVLMDKGTWKVVLPGLASVAEVKEDVKREQEQMFKEEIE